jgi:hypothetical protein
LQRFLEDFLRDRQQDRSSARLSCFEPTLRFGRLGYGHTRMDLDLHRAARNDFKKIVAHGENIFALRQVHRQHWPCSEERAFSGQEHDVEWRDRSRRRAEADEIAERPQAIERARESGISHPVVNDVATFAFGDLLHARGKVVLAVVDHVVAAVLACKLCLLGRPNRTDNGRAEVLCPLRQDEANAAGRCMHKDCVTRLDVEGTAQQILRCQALQHHRCGGLEVDGVGQVNEEVRRHNALLGIGAERLDIGDTIAGGEVSDALADREDLAGPLLAGGEGQVWRRKGAGAQVDIDEVDADRPVADADLAGSGLTDVDVLVASTSGPPWL